MHSTIRSSGNRKHGIVYIVQASEMVLIFIEPRIMLVETTHLTQVE